MNATFTQVLWILILICAVVILGALALDILGLVNIKED